MEHKHDKQMIKRHYLMLGVSTAISAVIMYVSMFAMIDTGQDFFNNINMLYMALLMAAPMGLYRVWRDQIRTERFWPVSNDAWSANLPSDDRWALPLLAPA